MAGARQAVAAFAVEIFQNSSDSDSDDSDPQEEPLPRREPFLVHHITERLLFQRTQLDRRVFNYVVDVLTPILTKNTKKGRYEHLTPAHKLYIVLQFYASGSFQWLVGSSAGVSQASVSRVVDEVTDAFVEVSPQFVKFPTAAEYPAVKQAFYRLGVTAHGTGFPHVLGVIDCTHCRLKAPVDNPEQYLNRHLYHSINVQLIAGLDLKIYNVLASFPGSNHDSFIWRNSVALEALSQGNFPEGWLVGDSGYPQEPWLMTPIHNPNLGPEQLYNSVHISTRNPVERVNGVLKSRWYVLDSALGYEPGKVCKIEIACCVLHNICTEYNLDVEDYQEHPLANDVPCGEQEDLNFIEARRDLIL